MSLQLVANHLAQKGRGPDSTLVHMSNREVAGLQALAKKHGGSLTTNPDTGLPEAGFLDSLLPTIAGGALTYFSGGAITPMMSAGIVGGISALDSKDLGKGLMAGLGAYGGGSMVGGLAGMGLASGAATATAPAQEAAMQEAIKGGTYQNAVGEGASKFGSMFANKPMEAISSFGGGSGLNAARNVFAAAAPAIMADQNVKTTTPAPERGKIRPYTFNAQQMNPSQTGPVSGERRYFNNEFTAGDPYSAANGGLVALARGGYAQQPLLKPTAPLPENNMYGASRDAYDYLMGVNPTGGGRPYNPNYPINDIHIDDGANLNPNTPKTGKGHYEFDPVTRQYKWIPDPIKPVDVAAPVFENPMQTGGGGGGGNRQTSPEGAPGEGFNPSPAFAQSMLDAGKNLSTTPVMAPFGLAAKTLGALATKYGSYLSSVVERNEAAKNAAANPDAGALGVQSSRVRSQLRSNEGYGPGPDGPEGPGNDGLGGISSPTGDPGISGVTAGVGEAGRGMPNTGGSMMGTGAPGVNGDPNQGNEGMHSVQGSRGGGEGGGAVSGGNGSLGNQSAATRGALRSNEGYGPGPGGDAQGGYLHHGRFDQRMAHGGIADLHQYNLGSYSDGGRLLKGPGDGVSDDIPATIGHGQPARLADGEFVVPARIVSELGNGSTDAGARELYKMMDRIQAGRKKTVGKNQVAKNSKSVRHLPA
jgi:hypothetical protein